MNKYLFVSVLLFCFMTLFYVECQAKYLRHRREAKGGFQKLEWIRREKELL